MKSLGIECNWALSDLSPDDIAEATDAHVDKFRAAYDVVGALKPDQVTFESCIKVRLAYTVHIMHMQVMQRVDSRR